MSKILLVGATGLIGGHYLTQLLSDDRFSKVYVWGRSLVPIEHPKLEQRLIDFEVLKQDNDAYPFPFANEGVVICCLGTTMAQAKSKSQFELVDLVYPLMFAQLARKHGIPQMQVVSSMGADASSAFFYLKTKGVMEAELAKLGLKCLQIFRPALLLGEHKDKRPMEKLSQQLGTWLLKRKWFTHYFARHAPIAADQVARFMLQALGNGPAQAVQIYLSPAMHADPKNLSRPS